MSRTSQQGGPETAGTASGGRDGDRRGAEAFREPTAFGRLARTHALSVGGDALLAIALADSLFFDVDPNDARWRVGAYLILTLAPFAIVAPFLGPVMDRMRGGHRFMIIGTAVVRAMLMAALVFYVQQWPLFPLAFGMLVMGKTYAVAKSAVVPTTVADEADLVKSNSRLAILSAAAGAGFGIPGVALLTIGGASWVLGFGMLVFLGAAVAGFRIPATRVATRPAAQEEREELRSTGILLASSAMGYLRGGTGFVTMLLAFDLRGGIDPGPTSVGVEVGHRVRESLGLERLDLTAGGAPPWHFGVALIGVGLGGLLGNGGVPRLRARLAEERILAFALIALTGLALLAAVSTGLFGAFIMAAAIAMAAGGGKQAFDAIVQRDAPRANLGRTFSRYESRFQLIWVLGALLPVVVPLPARVGYILVATSAAFVAITYWFGRTPNPAAIVSDGVVDEGFDRLAGALPGPLSRRVPGRDRRGGAAEGNGGSAVEPSRPDQTRVMPRPGSDDPTTESPQPRRADRTRRASRPSSGERTRRSRRPEPESEFDDPTADPPLARRRRPADEPADPQDETQVFTDAPPRRPPVVRPPSGDDA
ncbi:MAG: hypothetical protein AAGA93_16430 [Actinomycetota bacterium]